MQKRDPRFFWNRATKKPRTAKRLRKASVRSRFASGRRTQGAVPEGWDAATFAYEFDVEPETLVVPVMELFNEEDIDPDIAVFKPGYWGWDEGRNCGMVEEGSSEWGVAPDFETAYNLAVAFVEDQASDARTAISYFSKELLERFIDEEELKKAWVPDEIESMRDWVEDKLLHEDDLEDLAEAIGFDITPFEEEDEDGWVELNEEKLAAALENEVDEIAEAVVFNNLQGWSSLYEYLVSNWGAEEAFSYAMKWAFDAHALADGIVDMDGPGPTLSSYDSELHELPSGGVYWRTN
jgi:hypothetical protein